MEDFQRNGRLPYSTSANESDGIKVFDEVDVAKTPEELLAELARLYMGGGLEKA